jgi:hypothetical protein
MLMELLKHGGQATEEQIARIYLSLDPTQQKYYENKVRKMVGEVLKENGITTRNKSIYEYRYTTLGIITILDLTPVFYYVIQYICENLHHPLNPRSKI